MIELPLTFGTITVVTVLLLLVATLAKYIIDLVLFGFKFLLNQDHPNAIKIDVKNPLSKLFDLTLYKFMMTSNILYCDERGKYCVIKNDHSAYDEEGTTAWVLQRFPKCVCWYDTKEEAKTHCKYKEDAFSVLNWKMLLFFPLIDVTLYGLMNHFLPTIIIVGLVAIVTGVRWLSGKIYENFNSTDKRITKVEDDMSEIKGK